MFSKHSIIWETFCKMKLTKLFLLLIDLATCSNFGLTAGLKTAGDDESYLMHTRRNLYHTYIHRLSQIRKVTMRHKLSNEATAQLRARLTKILTNKGFYSDMENVQPKTTKVNQIRDRFRKYHSSWIFEPSFYYPDILTQCQIKSLTVPRILTNKVPMTASPILI